MAPCPSDTRRPTAADHEAGAGDAVALAGELGEVDQPQRGIGEPLGQVGVPGRWVGTADSSSSGGTCPGPSCVSCRRTGCRAEAPVVETAAVSMIPHQPVSARMIARSPAARTGRLGLRCRLPPSTFPAADGSLEPHDMSAVATGPRAAAQRPVSARRRRNWPQSGQ